ncbi:MAG TPA: TauD/TfdA family dioxygenase [Acidimicrobiales bacterium]|nr:TauD/TfdA family dioxygenase [Acidimicrobiales bacterium]
MLRISPTDATLGAIVDGIDLRTLDHTSWPSIEESFHRHAVLVFRGQHLDDDAHLAFSRWFGPLERATAIPKPGQRADFTRLANTDGDGAVVDDPTSRVVQSLVGNQEWHSDSSFKRVAAKASILAAVVVPDEGGETQFADMRAGYDALPDEERARIDGLVAQHSFAGDAYLTDAEREILAPVEHPVVHRHPATGRRALFVGRHARSVVGFDPDEGRRLIDELREHACRPPRIYTHRWSAGDVVVWDNRCVLHRGRPWDMAQPRVMRRLTIAGDDDGSGNEWLLD